MRPGFGSCEAAGPQVHGILSDSDQIKCQMRFQCCDGLVRPRWTTIYRSRLRRPLTDVDERWIAPSILNLYLSRKYPASAASSQSSPVSRSRHSLSPMRSFKTLVSVILLVAQGEFICPVARGVKLTSLGRI